MLERINKIIDDWDPMGLFPFAPKDEYTDESALIIKAAQKTSNSQVLAKDIMRIFADSFGDDVFSVSFDECANIAANIITEMSHL